MRTKRWAAAVALAAGMVAVVDAQQPGRRPGGGQGGPGGGGGPVGMLKQRAVAEDIKLSEEQIGKLKDWLKEYEPKAQEKVKAKLKDVPRDEYFQKMAAANAEVAQETYKELEGLLKPEQVTRLHQIERQSQGTRAFRNEQVASALKLTDEQKEKIKGISDSTREATGKAMQGAFGPNVEKEKSDAARKEVQKLTAEAVAKISADVLTAEQKTTWKEMVGEPFDTSKLNLGFGFGGGFGGPGGGNRPQPKKD